MPFVSLPTPYDISTPLDLSLDMNPFSAERKTASNSVLAKTKPSYAERTTRGGQFTLALVILSILLSLSELQNWWVGAESHHFSVERGVSHELQINLDIVVAMRCEDLHVNVQDAAGDRIMAGELLRKDHTVWALWAGEEGKRKRRTRGTLNQPDLERQEREEEDQHVGHVIGHMKEGGKKFAKSPRLRRGETSDSCRIYGSLEGNKVQGDFHITARGHGYVEWGMEHLDHQGRFADSLKKRLLLR